MRRVCVFCGGQPGADPLFLETARQLGETLVARGLGLVYGGASTGLMGAVADAALAQGGEAIGVIPRTLVERELAHPGLTSQHIVETMHQRKALMADLASGFIALPGGFGTLDELFEIVTWAQIGLHRKPVLVLNITGYYDPLIAFVEHAVNKGFIRAEYRPLLLEAHAVDEALDRLTGHPGFVAQGGVDTRVI